MAGVNVTGGDGRGRKALDADLNMVPMIDLLMVTIAFLLVTAVWSHMNRLEGSAQVPGPMAENPPPLSQPSLHVDIRSPEHFVLSWRQGHDVGRTVEVAREYPALAQAITKEWRTSGVHTSPSDTQRDEAVLHTSNDTLFSEMVAAMDAIEATKRAGVHGESPAFALTLATQ